MNSLFARCSPELRETVRRALFDIPVSVIALVLFGIFLFLPLAIAIRLDSPGPIIYRQKRAGRNGTRFTLFKMRSMPVNARPQNPDRQVLGDECTTRVGKWMRKLKLDEFPQFLNVLFGHMNIVGPRPMRWHLYLKRKRSWPLYAVRARVRPGITGKAALLGLEEFLAKKHRTQLVYDYLYLREIRKGAFGPMFGIFLQTVGFMAHKLEYERQRAVAKPMAQQLQFSKIAAE